MSQAMVTLPFNRLVAAAKEFGNQDAFFCPPVETPICFDHRNLKPFLAESVTEPERHECVECWLRFFTNGD